MYIQTTLEQKVSNFTADFTGKSSGEIALYDDLVKDLHIDGDDAMQFVTFFSDKFKIDMSDFHFNKHFRDETSLLTEKVVLMVPMFFIAASAAFLQAENVYQAQIMQDIDVLGNFNGLLPLSQLWSRLLFYFNLNPSDFFNWIVYLLLNLPFSYICVKFIGKMFSKKEDKKKIYFSDLFRIAKQKKWDL